MRITPAQAVLGALWITTGHISFLQAELNAVAQGELKLKRAEVNQLAMLEAEERERLVKFGKVAADMGVDERLQRLREVQTQQLMKLIELVTADLKLNKAQQAKLGPSLRRHIEKLQENGKGEPSVADLVPKVSKMRKQDRRQLMARAKARTG